MLGEVGGKGVAIDHQSRSQPAGVVDRGHVEDLVATPGEADGQFVADMQAELFGQALTNPDAARPDLRDRPFDDGEADEFFQGCGVDSDQESNLVIYLDLTPPHRRRQLDLR